jgi:hypothetical protein
VGRSYRTVNGNRSALSSTLAVNLGIVSVGVDPLVNKLLKGIYHKSPPTARYSQTWNPDTVLLISYFDDTAGVALSLLELSRKLVTLLALITLLRNCELSPISPRKNQHFGPLRRMSAAAWQLNVSICPGRCLGTF